MRVIDPSFEILNAPDAKAMLRHIELAARTCYKSEEKINEGSAADLIKRLIKMGHHSVLEHSSLSVRFICDRGVSHELVRHRLCSFSQESTRYCNYAGEKFGKEITFVRPVFWKKGSLMYKTWEGAMKEAEKAYLYLLNNGASPQEARSVLPNSLKTDIVVTANIRQWRLVFNQRCASAAHPQMRQSMLPVLDAFSKLFPVFFEDIYSDFQSDIDKFTGMSSES
ncbi:FAD-dependent thymidylate synthase [Desulforegula conservatrix]|uniref:FAD-dependent thymidylate synthase n=1 Tax=Desulforegula conservatrix TaxID=153026 RepID=UPI0003FC731D|nr:FAD-dependent thymidylate synthase [Desulforegula conservatrix]